MKFSNKTYDILKWVAMTCVPALGTLYFALASIWGLPYGQEIVGTLTAIDTFLGICLGISTKNYIEENEDGGNYTHVVNYYRKDMKEDE